MMTKKGEGFGWTGNGKKQSPQTPDKQLPLNEERGSKTLTTNHLTDRLANAGKPKPGQNDGDR